MVSLAYASRTAPANVKGARVLVVEARYYEISRTSSWPVRRAPWRQPKRWPRW